MFVEVAKIEMRGDLMDTEIDLKYLKDKRESLGFSQKDMATQLGFKNASTYLKYEIGEYKIKAEMLPLLAKLLKCNITSFFTKNVSEIETPDFENKELGNIKSFR